MTSFTQLDWIGFIALFAYTFIFPLSFTNKTSNFNSGVRSKWYFYLSRHVPITPPGFVFGIVWTILYILIWISVFLWWRNESQLTGEYESVLILHAVNIGLNTLWYPTFYFDLHDVNQDITNSNDLQLRIQLWNIRIFFITLAMILLIGIFGTGLSIIILFGIEGAWISFGLYVPYILWVVYAGVLNIYYLHISINKGLKNVPLIKQ